jgi:hypothetical protein
VAGRHAARGRAGVAVGRAPACWLAPRPCPGRCSRSDYLLPN